MEEIEVKFLEVDVEALRDILKKFGATFVGEYEYRRKTFDYPDLRLDADHSWIRLRDEGDRVTLTYKQRQGVGEDSMRDTGMKEIEITVSDFDMTASLLHAIGLIEKQYEENRRERWSIGDVVCDIDSWPLIPTYVELEGPSLPAIKEISERLGFDWNHYKMCSSNQIYKQYGINKKEFSVLTFDRQIKKDL